MAQSIKLLREQKEEYMEHLFDVLYEPCIKQFQKIYDDTLRMKECTAKNVLKMFQQQIAKIPEWNQLQVEQVYEHIISSTKCSYFPDLLKTVYVLTIKVILLGIPEEKRSKIKLKIPSPESFIHRCLIHMARDLWKRPYLFYHQARSIERQNNLYHCEMILRKKLKAVIRETIPMDWVVSNFSELENMNMYHSESEDEQEDSESDSEEETSTSDTQSGNEQEESDVETEEDNAEEEEEETEEASDEESEEEETEEASDEESEEEEINIISPVNNIVGGTVLESESEESDTDSSSEEEIEPTVELPSPPQELILENIATNIQPQEEIIDIREETFSEKEESEKVSEIVSIPTTIEEVYIQEQEPETSVQEEQSPLTYTEEKHTVTVEEQPIVTLDSDVSSISSSDDESVENIVISPPKQVLRIPEENPITETALKQDNPDRKKIHIHEHKKKHKRKDAFF